MISVLLAGLLSIQSHKAVERVERMSNVPGWLCYVAGNRKNIQWTVIGAGQVDPVSKALKAHRFSYAFVSPFDMPDEVVNSPDMLPRMFKDHWGGVAVDKQQYVQARTFLASYARVHSKVLLLPFNKNPQVVFPAPPDADLIQNFTKHRADFEEIVKMASHDKGLTRVDRDWTNPRDPSKIGISQVRIDRYRALFRDAQIPRGFSAGSEPGGKQIDVSFMFWGFGFAASDEYGKGYAYLTTPPKALRTTLDGFEPRFRQPYDIYRHVEGNWYLYFEFFPN